MIIKTFAGTLIPAGVAVTSAFSYEYLIKPQNIEQKLEWDNYRALGTGDNEDTTAWTEIVNKWEENKLSDFVKTTEDTSDNSKKISELKKKCTSIMKEKISEENYENAKKYCAIPIDKSR